jgi:hypothetical protein
LDALEALLVGGATLPYQATAKVLEPLFSLFRSERWNNHEHDRAARALPLLLFTDDPAAGASEIQANLAYGPLNASALPTLVVRIGYSRRPEALELLKHILSQAHAREHLGDSWIDAAAQIDTTAAREMLLDLILGPDAEVPEAGGRGASDRAAVHLAALFRKDEAVRQRLLKLDKSEISARGRDLLVRVSLRVGTEEALFACLDLLDAPGLDGYTDYELRGHLEEIFLQHLPIAERSGAYRLSPRAANDLRERLIAMAETESPAQQGARRLLTQIELSRLAYGRPNGEPRNPRFAKGVMWPLFCGLDVV